MLSRKKRSTITAALAVLMALPVTGEAAENVPEPGPFKARVIEIRFQYIGTARQARR